MREKKIGVAITGSFCTFSQILPVLERLQPLRFLKQIRLPRACPSSPRNFPVPC